MAEQQHHDTSNEDVARSVSPIDDPMDIDGSIQEVENELQSAFSSSSEEDNKENEGDDEDTGEWLENWQKETPERPSGADGPQFVLADRTRAPVSNIPDVPANREELGADGYSTLFEYQIQNGVVQQRTTWRGPNGTSRIIMSYQDDSGATYETEQFMEYLAKTDNWRKHIINRFITANGSVTTEEDKWTNQGSSPDELVQYVENRVLDAYGNLTESTTTWTDLNRVTHVKKWNSATGEYLETFRDRSGNDHEIRTYFSNGQWWTLEQWRDRQRRERSIEAGPTGSLATGTTDASGTRVAAAVTGQPDNIGDYDYLAKADGTPLHPAPTRDRAISKALRGLFRLRTVPHTTVQPSPLRTDAANWPDTPPKVSPESSPESSPDSSPESSPDQSPTQGEATNDGPEPPTSTSNPPSRPPSTPTSPYKSGFSWDEEEPSEHDNALFNQTAAAPLVVDPNASSNDQTGANNQTGNDDEKKDNAVTDPTDEPNDGADSDESDESDDEGSSSAPRRKKSRRGGRGNKQSAAQQASKKARDLRRKARRAEEAAAAEAAQTNPAAAGDAGESAASVTGDAGESAASVTGDAGDSAASATGDAGESASSTTGANGESTPDATGAVGNGSNNTAAAVTNPEPEIVSPTNSDDIQGPDEVLGLTAQEGIEAANAYEARTGSATGQERLLVTRLRLQDEIFARARGPVPPAPGSDDVEWRAYAVLLANRGNRYRHLRNQAVYDANARARYNEEQRNHIHALREKIGDLQQRVQRAELLAGGTGTAAMKEQISKLREEIRQQELDGAEMADMFEKQLEELEEAKVEAEKQRVAAETNAKAAARELHRRNNPMVDNGTQTDAEPAAPVVQAASGPTYASAETQSEGATADSQNAAPATTSTENQTTAPATTSTETQATAHVTTLSETPTGTPQAPNMPEECKKRCEELATQLKDQQRKAAEATNFLFRELQQANAVSRAAMTKLIELQQQTQADQEGNATEGTQSPAPATASAETQTDPPQAPEVSDQCKKRCEQLAEELSTTTRNAGKSVVALMCKLQQANADKKEALQASVQLTKQLNRAEAAVTAAREATTQAQQGTPEQNAVAMALQQALQNAEVGRLQRQVETVPEIERRTIGRAMRDMDDLRETIAELQKLLTDLGSGVPAANNAASDNDPTVQLVMLQSEIEYLQLQLASAGVQLASAEEAAAEQLQQATELRRERDEALGRPEARYQPLFGGECRKCAQLKVQLAEEQRRVEMAHANRAKAWKYAEELEEALSAATAGQDNHCPSCLRLLASVQATKAELEARVKELEAEAAAVAAASEQNAASESEVVGVLRRHLEEAHTQRDQAIADAAETAERLEDAEKRLLKHALVAQKLGQEKHALELEAEEMSKKLQESPGTASLRAARQRARDLENIVSTQNLRIHALEQALKDARARLAAPAVTPATVDRDATPRARPTGTYQPSPALDARQRQAAIRRNAEAAARNTRLQKSLGDFEYVPRERRFLHLNL